MPGSSDANASTTRSRSSGEAWTSPAAATRIGRPFSMPASCPTRRGYMPCNGGYHPCVSSGDNTLNGMVPTLKKAAAALRDAGIPVSGRGRGRLLGTRRPVDRPRPRFPDQAGGRRPRARDTGGRGVAPGEAAGGMALQGVGRGRARRPDLLPRRPRRRRRADRARRGARGRGDDDARADAQRTCSSRS